MKTFLTILLVTLCAATSYGQTMKALSYNTNGVVAYSSTNALRFTNEVRFGGGDLQIDTAGGIYWGGALRYEPETQTFHEQIQFDSPLTASNTRDNLGLGATWLTNGNVTNFRTAIGLGATNDVAFNSVNVTNAAATRTNIGLPLPALTKTSNVTAMRALAGSTNTNEPFSGTIEYLNHTSDPFYLDVSNGIILRRYE
jgi:hypothetical protein